MDDTEVLLVSVRPFEVVHQRPHEVAAQVDALGNGPAAGVEMPAQIGDPARVVDLMIANDGIREGRTILRDEQWHAPARELMQIAQAAVTIPTLVIGLETGLFDTTLFNAAILMILLTSITSPLIVQRFAPDLQTVSTDDEQVPLFGRILVPVVDVKQAEGLVSLASLLARTSKGKVFAVSVSNDKGLNGGATSFGLHKEMLGRVTDALNDP